MKLGKILAAAVGVGLLLVLLAKAGLAAVLGAAEQLGWLGFAGLCAFQLALGLLAGLAWARLGFGRTDAKPGRFVWARLVREAASQALPFAQIGGVALGGRALALEGVEGSFAAASTLTDMAVEFVTQVAYATLGAVLLQVLRPRNPLGGAVLVVVFGLALMAAGLVYAQGRGVRLVERLLRRFGRGSGEAATLSEALVAVRQRPGALALAALGHLAAWVLTGVQTWMILRLLHVPVSLPGALVIDSLTSGAKALAFLVPGAVGVQEGALAALGALFGAPLPAALALSLIRRGRDLALALPVLAIWQARHGARIWLWRGAPAVAGQAETEVPDLNASKPRARSEHAGQTPQP